MLVNTQLCACVYYTHVKRGVCVYVYIYIYIHVTCVHICLGICLGVYVYIEKIDRWIGR